MRPRASACQSAPSSLLSCSLKSLRKISSDSWLGSPQSRQVLHMIRLFAVGPSIGENGQHSVSSVEFARPPTCLSLNSYRRRFLLPRPRHKRRKFSEIGAEDKDLGCGTVLPVGYWAPRGVASGMALEWGRPGQPHVRETVVRCQEVGQDQCLSLR